MQELEELFKIDESELTNSDLTEIDEAWIYSFEPNGTTTYHNPEAEAKRVVSNFVARITLFNSNEYTVKALTYIYESLPRQLGFSDILTPCICTLLEKTIRIMQANEANPTKEAERNSSEVAGLREAATSSVCESSEAVEALHRRVQELEDEKQRLEQELSRLTDEVEELRDQQPRHGRPTNSGLNRHERTALLVELLASVTSLDAQELTGANAKLQGQGLKALACVSGLITDIAKGQRSKVLSEYRSYQQEGKHEQLRDQKLQPARTNVVALIKEIAAMQQRLQTTD